jgi:hypothetical protein
MFYKKEMTPTKGKNAEKGDHNMRKGYRRAVDPLGPFFKNIMIII